MAATAALRATAFAGRGSRKERHVRSTAAPFNPSPLLRSLLDRGGRAKNRATVAAVGSVCVCVCACVHVCAPLPVCHY